MVILGPDLSLFNFNSFFWKRLFHFDLGTCLKNGKLSDKYIYDSSFIKFFEIFDSSISGHFIDPDLSLFYFNSF